MPRKFQPGFLPSPIAAVLLGICCATSCGPANQGTGSFASNPSAAFDVSTLDFETPDLKEHFQSFDRVAREAAAGQGWKHREYSQGGNFISAVWAFGEGYDADCRPNREPSHQVGTRKFEVDTIVVSGKAKSAALTFELVDASPKEWSLFGNYREATEQGITGAGWGVTLFKWSEERPKPTVPFHPYEQTAAKLELGPRFTYQVQNSSVDVASDLPQDKDFQRYLASAESLRDTYLEANGRLLKKVQGILKSHQVEKKVFSKGNGKGIPPPPTLKKLTAEEEAAELEKAREHFARLDKLVEGEFVAMHAALRKAFPFEKCWPELIQAAVK